MRGAHGEARGLHLCRDPATVVGVMVALDREARAAGKRGRTGGGECRAAQVPGTKVDNHDGQSLCAAKREGIRNVARRRRDDDARVYLIWDGGE